MVLVLLGLAAWSLAYAGPTAEYLCELGATFYRIGKYDDALLEFKKALMLEPDNQTAKQYIAKIFQQGVDWQQASLPSARQEAMSRALESISAGTRQEIPENVPIQAKDKQGYSVAGLSLSGHAQLSLGMTGESAIYKRANYDLNEKNYRMLSNAAFDRRENTYDPRIYDRLALILDTDNEEGLGFHGNIVVDPWSFTGRTDKVMLTSTFGVPADIELKYWSNTGYTINEVARVFQTGDSIALPEIKVVDGKTTPTSVGSNFSGVFNIPELKIHRQFQPLRELWFDYRTQDIGLRFFPIAYQDQALDFDDPLKLSNNHIWWEDSPWIRRWKPGLFNSGGSPDFTKGSWDNSLSYFTRDSDGTRLTALRGFALEFMPQDETNFYWTVATPKHLWQDYEQPDNLISAARLKHLLSDNLSLGLSSTARFGFNVDQGTKTDARNHVGAVDLGYEIVEGTKGSLEVAHSESDLDLTNSQFKTRSRGNAYYFSVVSRFPRKSIMGAEYGYEQIKPEKDEPFLAKLRFFGAHMDDGFEPALSSYRNTRKDTFWSRHIHFRKPFDYYYSGVYSSSLGWDDISPYRIGDGIDVGRDALGFRFEAYWQDRLEYLFDLRNVHQADGKYVETVARDELTYKLTQKLTAKTLAIYHDLPKTKGGIDPFIYDSQTGLPFRDFSADPIDDGKDPTLKTGSLGFEYAFSDMVAINGIWERTNDYTLAYDNFPRGILNSSQPSDIFTEFGNVYRRDLPFLFDQQFFPQPPYPYYDIFKAGLRFNPLANLQIYLDYTRNEFESAGQIDDSMNHTGIEAAYFPLKKLGFYLRYVYSRWQDLDRIRQGITKPAGHHNVFGEIRYMRTEDEELILQYGEGGRTPIASVKYDPFGTGLATIDTQHIFRLFYRLKF